jgi:type II secretory pathway predicted ATPase ExeA
MYEPFFGLTKRPFAAVPCPDQYYPAATIEAARQTLARCIRRAEGPAMVIGPAGTGKTLLCHCLAKELAAEFQVVLLAGQGLDTRRALLQAILYGLGQRYRGMDEGELRLALVDHLTSAEASPAAMVLLADEAHAMPLRLLDEIRVIGHVVHGNEARTRIVLAGGPLLEERLANPKLDSFSQRLAARCYLEAFNRGETETYIQTQLDNAGGCGGEVFPTDACQSVYQATDGVPRLVNHICDHVLLLALAAGKSVIRPEHVEEAWADLQQLPTPWNGEGKEAQSGGNVVEFGGLDDEPEAVGRPAAPSLTCDASHTAVTTALGAPARDPLSPEPAERIRQIETLISHLEEPGDFQPAGPTGPEVEMVIEDFGNPFGEPFEEEEMVVDRFPRSATRVATDEGPEMRDEGRGTRDEGRGMRDEGREMKDEGREMKDEGREMRDEEPATPMMPPRRKPKYGQLFARLRREAVSR